MSHPDRTRHFWVFLWIAITCNTAAVHCLRWTKEPLDPTEAVEGTDVVLGWDYDLEGATFRQLEWRAVPSGDRIAVRTTPSGVPIYANFGPRFTIDKNEGATLIISSVNKTDSGQYRCVLEQSDLREIVSTITLKVVVPPQITLPPKDISVNESQSVTFSCQASGDPKPIITWTKNGENVCSGVNLTIQETKRGDAGLYTCTAHNSKVAPSASASALLTVNFFDDVRIEPASKLLVKHGSPLYLKCAVTADPDPQWTWLKDGVVIQSGESLFKKNATELGDTGKYVCVAKHRNGEHSAGRDILVLETSERKVAVGLSFRIVDVTWNDQYDDTESQERKNITEAILQELWIAFRRTPVAFVSSMIGIDILDIRRGSVMIWMKLTFDSMDVSNKQARALLADAVSSGWLGEFRVNKTSISSIALNDEKATEQTKEEPKRNTGVESALIAAVTVLSVTVIGLVIYILWLKRNGGRHRSNKPDVILQELPHVSGNYADLQEESRFGGPSRDKVAAANIPTNVYAPLIPETRTWEVPRKSLNIVKVIGKGAFGQVAKATAMDLPGKPGPNVVAVKMLKENASESDRNDLNSELELMKKLKRHPHVIELLGCVTKSEPMMVVIEYIPYGDLLGYLRKSRGLNDTYYKDPDVKPTTSLTPQQLMKFAWQVADGMAFLSSHKIVHRDLAARNVLVGEEENCKVTDFGMARDIHQEDIYQKTSKGRLPVKWTAYEALMYGTYTTKSDVWSYGVVLFEIFTVGGCPYPRKDGRKIAELLQRGYRMPKPGHVDDELYQIMMSCWLTDPDGRPTFQTLKETMKEMGTANKRLINMGKYDKKLYENLEDLFA